MKTVVLRFVLLAAIGLAVSFTALGQPGQAECDRALRDCLGQCDSDRDQALAANERRRREIEAQLTNDLRACSVEHADKQGILTCRQEKRDAARQALATLLILDRGAEELRLRCIAGCRTQRAQCPAPTFNANVGQLEVNFECIPSPGAPCFKEVSKFCQQISGACEGCGLSLCGGGDWTFDAEVPLVVTLVAGTDPLTNPRVLARSTMNGRQAVLNVPPDIKLAAGEQLYISFSSTEKPGKPVNVAVGRKKK